LALPCSAQADISPEDILDKTYGKHDKQKNCWYAMGENSQRYCMKIDQVDKRATASGKRLYLLVAGEAVDEKGEPNGAHATAGLVGAFVVEEHNGHGEIIASDAHLSIGEYGVGPTGWKLLQLGPSDYWGWQNTAGGGNQGVFGSWYSILAPYGKKIRDLGGFLASFEDSGRCTNKQCERSSSDLESKLAIDASQPNAKVYPLQITVTGKYRGKKLTPKTWTLPFDTQSWKYVQPEDWLFRKVEL
jgi:hypothetical protein